MCKLSEMVPARVVSDNWDSIRWSHVLEAASNENQCYHTVMIASNENPPQINVTTHISTIIQI